MEATVSRHEKIKLTEINPYLTCYLCKGYLIDATTISECLHSFCRSCIIRFLQENSFCPVCEVIINKAKPNLKLDKTLQDIVYKLVPELFLREMTRRKQYYRQYPQIAAKVSPEDRGEDTERTIFNPQDFISLSMEYVSDDSTPGAIRLPCSKNGLDKNKSLSIEESQALMKRYLQCPGMCRVEVLKKFVRNKYNVDTNLFYIDILYKRVPLPDHYTLIDIAYIYSWKRNEPMKFFFRITDLNKVSERFDYFNSQSLTDFVPTTPPPRTRNSSERISSSKKRERNSKVSKQPSQKTISECDRSKSEVKQTEITESKREASVKCDNEDNKSKSVDDSDKCLALKVKDESSGASETIDKKGKPPEVKGQCKTPEEVIKNQEEGKQDLNVPNKEKCEAKETPEVKPVAPNFPIRLDVAEQIRNRLQSEKSDKNSVYTNITLNRTNNVEIITKIEKVSNKDGQPIRLNIFKKTIKQNRMGGPSPSKTSKKVLSEKKTSQNKQESQGKSDKRNINNNTSEVVSKNVEGDQIPNTSNSLEEEKNRFFKSIELTAKKNKKEEQNPVPKIVELPKPTTSQKRKSSSPLKNEKAKKPKIDKKPTTKIIIQPKLPSLIKPNVPVPQIDQKRNCGIQSLIDSCKINIPSSLSITIKESSDTRPAVLPPPTKNYIEILKLPDDDSKTMPKVEIPLPSRLCDNDSEQKVDQDLSEIAKSLTEKIPLSTTVSQIVGPKPQYLIPVKSNVPELHGQIQPAPVPEIAACKALNVPKDNKLSPRSPQTFQKIFEESIKRPDGSSKSPEKESQKSALDLTNEAVATSKRNILEIAQQLYKKTKLEHEKTQEKSEEMPKVPIPRLPQRNLKPPQKNSKFEVEPVKYPQTLSNLHSNALGLNYTISVGPNVSTPKVNGIISPVKKDETKNESPSFASPKELASSSPRPNSIPRNMSPSLGYNSPRNSPKHSPKSSPMVKHMYAPMPTSMDQLRVQTYTPKIPSPKLNFPKLSPKSKLPSPSAKSTHSSPKPATSSQSLPQATSATLAGKNTNSPSSKTTTSKASPGTSQTASLSPNQILEKYNIQNLAQLTASLNFNAGNFGLNPGNQLAAIQHAMLLKHFEMQNRQNWLSMNQGPLLQYEKYLQSLKNNQNHLLGNIKEN